MDNRRSFLKKSAGLLSVAALGGITTSCGSTGDKIVRPYQKDAGIKFSYFMNPSSRRVQVAQQLAVNYAVSGVVRLPEKMPWDPECIQATKAKWDELGIKWIAVEGPPSLGNRAKLGLEGRDEEIENFITFMKNLKKYGDVDIICYNWMPVISWARTNKAFPGRGGALMLEMNYDDMKDAPLTRYGEVSKEQLWETLEYFIKAVMPEAEKIGMRLSLHPDDPQVDSIQGVSRIINTVANYDRIYEMYPKICNGITFCQANFFSMPDALDIPALIRRWGKDRINFVHYRNFRDLSGGQRPSTHFTETFHDEGDMDMYECMKAYIEIGFDGPMRPDHVAQLVGEEIGPGEEPGYTTLGCLYATGYMRGLAESIAKEMAKG